MTINNTFSEWLDATTKRAMHIAEISCLTIEKEAIGNTRQDMSRPILEQLLGNGYEVVEWDSGHSTHALCVELNHQKWVLEDFLTGLQHDAPIFERAHPGDQSCSLLVSGSDVPTVRVDSYGNFEEI